MDIFKIEQRGFFSPPDGGYPQLLPNSWRDSPDGEIRTDIPELSDEKLNELGWKGPIEIPLGDTFYKYNVEWNSETREFVLTELTEKEKKERIDYNKFWNLLIKTSAYAKIKTIASEKLYVNTIVTEFLMYITDAKRGAPDPLKIQEVILEILSTISFTVEELAELQQTFACSGMFSVYTLT